MSEWDDMDDAMNKYLKEEELECEIQFTKEAIKDAKQYIITHTKELKQLLKLSEKLKRKKYDNRTRTGNN